MDNSNQIISSLGPILPEIQKFLDELLDQGGMKKADPILKEMMLDDLNDRLSKFLFMTLAKELNDQELDTFVRLAEVDQAQGLSYLQDIRPQLPKFMLNALEEFRQIFLQKPSK